MLGSGYVESARWERLATLPVFTAHEWMEPHEQIEEEQMLTVYFPGLVALKLKLSLLACNIYWEAESIVEVEKGKSAILGHTYVSNQALSN